jgi:hypothetical protein
MFPRMKWNYLDHPNHSELFSSPISPSYSMFTKDICILSKLLLGTHPSISFIRIEIVLATQYCHYYECSKFLQHHQIAFSMIVLEWECSINHNSIMLQFSHTTNMPNLFSSYLTFLQFVHSLALRAFCI